MEYISIDYGFYLSDMVKLVWPQLSVQVMSVWRVVDILREVRFPWGNSGECCGIGVSTCLLVVVLAWLTGQTCNLLLSAYGKFLQLMTGVSFFKLREIAPRDLGLQRVSRPGRLGRMKTFSHYTRGGSSDVFAWPGPRCAGQGPDAGKPLS